MDATVKKLVALLDSSDVQLRIAAVRVLTEIGVSSPVVIRAFGRCLREPCEEVQLVALKGLARLGAGDVSNLVVPLILSTGVVRDHAMVVITAIGPSVAPQLQTLYEKADFNGKRAIITAMSSIDSRPALEALLKRLRQEPFELAQHIASRLCEALGDMKAGQQGAIFPAVHRLVKGKPDPRSPHVHTAGLLLLGCFRGPRLAQKAYQVLRNFVDSKHLPEVRRYALGSMNRLLPELSMRPDQVRFLEKLLCDDDWENVAQLALEGFRRVQLPAKSLPKLVDLLRKSPHFSVHIHVFDRLRGSNRAEIAAAILPSLEDKRFRVREAAESALRRIPAGIEQLFQKLIDSEDLDVTRRVNSILQEFPQQTRRKYLERAVTRLLTLFERKDPHYVSFLDFVRGVDPEPLRKKIYEKARKLKAGRSPHKWEQIAAYLQLLWENHLITADGRYLFAVSLIRQSPRNLDPTSRRADLGLRVIRALVYDSCEQLTKNLGVDKELKPEDYFYLGFHFCEEGDSMAPFGESMLEHVLKKFPRSSLAPQAEQKLELHREGKVGRGVTKAAAAILRGVRSKRSQRASRPSSGASKRSRLTVGSGGSTSTSAARTARLSASSVAAKKTGAKKTGAKKTAAKKTAAKKTAAKKTAAKKKGAGKGKARNAPVRAAKSRRPARKSPKKAG